MTHEEMIAMAREAGLGEHTNYEYEQIWELKNVEALERFAALVIAAERERCARVCEERGSFNSMYAHHILTGAAEAIRKGEKESLTVEARKPVPEFELIEKWEGE
jgi:hypothetical protein